MSLSNRPDHPIKAEFYVRLVTEQELHKNTVRNFYTTVNEGSPEGVLREYEVQGPDGGPATSALLHRVEDGKHVYEMPLTRNFTHDEIYELVTKLDYALTEGDFLLETSTITEEDCCPEYEAADGDYMDPELYEEIAERMSARLHEQWMNERIGRGWRYAENRSDENRAHPMLKPWTQLTEDQKAIDYNMPTFFVDILEDFGYSIVSTDELQKLLNKKK